MTSVLHSRTLYRDLRSRRAIEAAGKDENEMTPVLESQTDLEAWDKDLGDRDLPCHAFDGIIEKRTMPIHHWKQSVRRTSRAIR